MNWNPCCFPLAKQGERKIIESQGDRKKYKNMKQIDRIEISIEWEIVYWRLHKWIMHVSATNYDGARKNIVCVHLIIANCEIIQSQMNEICQSRGKGN